MNSYVDFLDRYLDDILAVLSIFFCGLIVCGIICIPFYCFKRQYKKHLNLKKNGNTARGTVTALYHKTKHMHGDDNTPSQTFEIDYARYSFQTDDGLIFTGDFPQQKKRLCSPGDKIEVYYNPCDPKKNCTQQQLEEDAKTNIFFIGLLVFMTAVDIVAVVLFLI